MSEFKGIELVQKDTVLNREHALGVCHLPGRKQICIYLREGGRLIPVAYIRDEEHAKNIVAWLSMLVGEPS